MKFSVIIPTCNRNDLLSSCLELLQKRNQTYSGDYEIIVSDDSKDNGAKSFIQNEFPWVKWVEGPKAGPAANRNNGAKLAVGEWLVFTDDDCLPQKNWLLSYDHSISMNSSGLVFEGKTMADRDRERFNEVSPINMTGNKLWSCNFAINKLFFIKLNGFDEGFPYAAMEDVDFYYRVIAKSALIFVQEALVIHPWRTTKPFGNLKRHLFSQKYFLNKHGMTRNMNYRLKRSKIFVTNIIPQLLLLKSYSMKGWACFIEACVIDFCLIFI